MTTVNTKPMLENEDPKVIRTWRNNQVSSTILLSLPHDLAKKHGIDVHTNLLAIDNRRYTFEKIRGPKIMQDEYSEMRVKLNEIINQLRNHSCQHEHCCVKSLLQDIK